MTEAEQIASLEDTIKYKDLEIRKLNKALDEAISCIDEFHYASAQATSLIQSILRSTKQ